MRIVISAMLLASAAAMPAFAQDHQDHQDHKEQHPQGVHADRGNAGQQRPQPGGQAQAPRPQAAPGGPTGGERGGVGGRPGGGAAPAAAAGRPGGFDGHAGAGARPGGPQFGGAQFGGAQFGGPGNDHGPAQAYRGGPAGHPGGPGGPGARPGGPGGPGGGWNRGWRDDRRYDWQGWRSANRNAFHVDRYRPPYGFGWGYRSYGIGALLAAAFYSESYWILDPGYFHLPPADGPYRWVRYYNDALLVDIRSGYVVDAIPDFFW